MSDFMYKVILIGDTSVGKSSVMKRFADDSFSESYLATIGVDFKFKTLMIDGKSAKLKIWDTAGQQRFRTITSTYYKGAQGIVIVFDTKQKKTLENIGNYWFEEINKYAEKDVKIMIIGNKLDMLNSEELTNVRLEFQQFITKFNKQGYLVSAKTGQNVNLAFQALTRECVKSFGNFNKNASQTQTVIDDIRKKKAQFELTTGKSAKKKKKCC